MNEDVVKFSDVISASIERLFKAGGLALVFIFLGFAAMIFGHFYSSNLSGYIFGIGALLSVSVLFLFLYTQFRGTVETRKIIRENKELLDATQEIAIGLTNTISETQSLLFKHAEDVGRILEISIPFLSQIPILNNTNLSETLNVNAVIVATSGKSKEIIDDVHKALINGDVQELKKYSEDLKDSTEALKKSLSTENKILKHIPDIKVIQDNFTKLISSFSSLLAVAKYYQEQADSVLNIVVPLLSNVKLFGIDQKMNELGVNKLKELSNQVNGQLTSTTILVERLHNAVIIGDTETITHTLKELSEIEKSAVQIMQNNKKGVDPSPSRT